MKNNIQRKMNILYALNSIFYYAGYCIVVGYISVYLLSQGFSNTWIGVILAASQVLSVALQPKLIAYIEKYHHSYVRKMLLYLVMCILLFSLILLLCHHYLFILAICVIVILAIVMAMMSLVNSLAFEYQDIHIVYGISRGLGSLSYALTSLLLGYLFTLYDVSYLPVLYIVDFVLLAIMLKCYSFHDEKEKKTNTQKNHISTLLFLKKYQFFSYFLLGIILIFFNHTLINHFLIQVIRNVNGDSLEMSHAIFIASCVELPMMFLYDKINQKLNTNILIKIAIVMFFIKHVITFLAVNINMIYIAQSLQMFAYALFIPASVYYVRENIHIEEQLKGQALVTMAMTLAGIFADLCGGVLIDLLPIQQVLLLATIISLLGVMIVLKSFRLRKIIVDIVCQKSDA